MHESTKTPRKRYDKALEGLDYINIKDMSEQEWLKIRRLGIGGSDAAAIVGMNPWASPYSVWADKTNRIAPKADNEPMRQGRDLENYVRQRFEEETGKKAHRKNIIVKNPKYPHAIANIDRWIKDENAILECKTTSSYNLKSFAGGEFPDNYYCQCMHYLAITGADRCYLAVLVLGREFLIFTIDRNEDEISALMQAEQAFWENYVLTDNPPPADGTAATTAAIKDIFGESIGESTIELFGMDGRLQVWQELQDRKKALEQDMERVKQDIQLKMGEIETAFTTDYKITWKTQNRKTFDNKRFAGDNPSLDLSNYFKTTASRVFVVKPIKKTEPARPAGGEEN
ncbi:MAG: YqaJ viral recombinase family protein [Firmicutes bacterium]|nr:YqaJ viral recombinase family protein [Bacillota bacterium]